MTAKEIVHQLQDDGIMTEDKAVMLIKSYALKIAQEAVEEERGRAERPGVVMGIDRLYGAIIRNIDKPEEES